MEKQLQQMLRAQAWERAKGELKSMTHTFYNQKKEFEPLNNAIQKFIKKIEFEGLID